MLEYITTGGYVMLANDYENLYQSDFYEESKREYIFRKNIVGLIFHEERVALANQLYLESKNCIGFSSNDPETASMVITKLSGKILSILSNNVDIIGELKDFADYDRITHPTEELTSIEAAIKVCDEHIKKIRTIQK